MKEYREAEGLNYSTMSKLDTNNPGAVFKDEERREPSEAMNRGSLVDCLLTSPSEFDDLFIVVDIPVLTPSLVSVLDTLLIEERDYTDANLLESAKDCGYGSNWKDDTIIKKLKTDDTEKYFNEKSKLITEKIQISQEEYDKAINVVEVLKNHEFTSFIFNTNNEVLFQVPIYWDKKVFNMYADRKTTTIRCKALLDIVILDHENRSIIPVDLKVKSDSKYSFPKSFLRYKYYLQAAHYSEALTNTNHYIKKHYKLGNFSFLVTNFDYPDPPIIFRCSNETMRIGTQGGIIQDRKVKGVNQLAEDYVWYKETENIDYPRDIYENKGVISI